MVCKEEVLLWFKELESYRRIDAVCALLNMCLPFELRFLGTYLEELGKRDFQELRGAELRANSHQDLAQELAQELAAPQPQPQPQAPPPPPSSPAPAVPPRLRRKMALYVSLLRSCNYACAATLYRVMFGLERAGLPAGAELQELLLLYTMALHHPAFTFDMHAHFGEMLDVLKREERRDRGVPVAPPPRMPQQPPLQPLQPQPLQRLPSVPPLQEMSAPPPAVAPVGVLYVEQPPPLVQSPILNSERMNEGIDPNVGIGNPVLTSSGEPIYPMLADNVAPPPGIPLPPYGIGEFVVSHPHWPGGLIVTPVNQPLELINYRAPTPPVQSRHSSPGDSRSGSPTVRAMPPPGQPNARSGRRPSREATPPPPHEHRLHHVVPNFNNLKISDRHAEDDRQRDLGDAQLKTLNQLQTGEMPNGLRRTSHSSKMPPYVNPPFGTRQSSGSESGSSTGSHSPPETPALSAPAPPGPGRPRQPPSPQYAFIPHYPRSAYTAPYPAYRPSYTYPVNGEAPVYGAQQYAGYVHMQFAPPPKVSCWNCGAMGHLGSDCKEPSIEEVTRSGGYQLDYSSAPPDMNDK